MPPDAKKLNLFETVLSFIMSLWMGCSQEHARDKIIFFKCRVREVLKVNGVFTLSRIGILYRIEAGTGIGSRITGNNRSRPGSRTSSGVM